MPRRKQQLEAQAPESNIVLMPITDTQQTFIQALLMGKNISEAALIAGVSRRTATYWLMHNDNPVRVEYDKQRLAMQEQFHTRIATLHEMALKALEDSLGPDAPPAIRFQAAKFLYEAHVLRHAKMNWPKPGGEMADEELEKARQKALYGRDDSDYLNHIQ